MHQSVQRGLAREPEQRLRRLALDARYGVGEHNCRAAVVELFRIPQRPALDHDRGHAGIGLDQEVVSSWSPSRCRP